MGQLRGSIPRVAAPLLAAATLWACSRNESSSASPSPAPPPAAAAEASPPTIPDARVEVNATGFQPSRIDVGAQRRVIFRRVSDSTCATAVVFPALNIEKPLPLNTDVMVQLPASAHGELAFQCGMGMRRGQVVVQ